MHACCTCWPQEHLLQSEVVALGSWTPEAGPAPPGITSSYLLFRGMRVRMGMASGLSSAKDLVLNKASGRQEWHCPILYQGLLRI